jgi:hypothetical protein
MLSIAWPLELVTTRPRSKLPSKKQEVFLFSFVPPRDQARTTRAYGSDTLAKLESGQNATRPVDEWAAESR